MAYGKTNYSATPVNVNQKRYSGLTGNKQLGNRTLFTNVVNNKKYFSSLDAEIHFGETYIDEITQITWGIEQATMPLFGYNSYTFDDIAVGARQISGSFVLNFTKAGFLYDVLKSVQEVSRSAYYNPPDLGENKRLQWDSNYEKEHKASWNKAFNIRIGYGDYNSNPNNNTMIVLHCVQITGCQQMLGIDGSPVAEVYTFIAKDVRYELNLPNTTDTDSSTSKEDTKEDKKPEFLFTVSNYKLSKTTENKKTVYKFDLDYKHSGGTIKDVNLKFKTNGNAIINSSGIKVNLGSDGKGSCTIPDEYTAMFDKTFATQSNFGGNAFVFVNIEITYVLDDAENTKYIRNQKVQLSK